jgi:hypothetical protein
MDRERSLEAGILRAFDRHLSPHQPPGRFAVAVILLSLTGLAPMIALYVAFSPGMTGHILGSQGALRALLRQLATNGLPVVFVVNFISLLLFARLRDQTIGPVRLVAADIGLRIGVFFGLHAVVFAGSALAFGSFGGDPVQALRVVAPTLLQAATFGNLSGAYLYATTLSALPLHMAAFARMLPRAAGRGVLLASGVATFALQAAVLTSIAFLFTALQG